MESGSLVEPELSPDSSRIDGSRESATAAHQLTGTLSDAAGQTHDSGISTATDRCSSVTDEASAVEALGLQPKLVASDSSNFKVTYPQDIELAELLLKQKDN